jgi:hypothetical protein
MFPFCFLTTVDSAIANLREAKNSAGKCPPPDPDLCRDAEFGKNATDLSNQFAVPHEKRVTADSSARMCCFYAAKWNSQSRRL